MNIRSAIASDVKYIHELIMDSAEHERMLFRSMANIYENLQAFIIAEDNGIIGCCALEVVWSDLAEIKSLAVAKDTRTQGVGTQLVEAALKMAEELGIEKVFALTLEPVFFNKAGFSEVPKSTLPMKVWRDCALCPKQQHCDEVAVVRMV